MWLKFKLVNLALEQGKGRFRFFDRINMIDRISVGYPVDPVNPVNDAIGLPGKAGQFPAN